MPIIGFRVALTAENFDNVVAFYRDGFGFDPGDLWTEEDGGQGQLFYAGEGTLEVFDPKYAAHVDKLEAGRSNNRLNDISPYQSADKCGGDWTGILV